MSCGCKEIADFTKNGREKLIYKIENIVEAAALEKVNIVCLPELWGEHRVGNKLFRKLYVYFQFILDFSIIFQDSHIRFTSRQTLIGLNSLKTSRPDLL